MLVNQKQTREVLRQIVFKVSSDLALHEDLTQEAFLHLWLREQQCPGQTQSWYLQSCRFFLQNFLRTGRSIDSRRRHKVLCSPAEVNARDPEALDEAAAGGSVVEQVSAREILALLARWLRPVEVQILGCLGEGFGVREIATRLNLSHTSVIRHRRNIARLALKLGVEPPPARNGNRPKSGTNPASNCGGRPSTGHELAPVKKGHFPCSIPARQTLVL